MRAVEFLQEATNQAWGRTGNTTTRKYRCTSGHRKGRVVAKAATCTAPLNQKKSQSLKRTRGRLGGKQAVNRARTIRSNAATKRLTTSNKSHKKFSNNRTSRLKTRR